MTEPRSDRRWNCLPTVRADRSGEQQIGGRWPKMTAETTAAVYLRSCSNRACQFPSLARVYFSCPYRYLHLLLATLKAQTGAQDWLIMEAPQRRSPESGPLLSVG